MPDRTVYSTDPSWKPPCRKCGLSPCACSAERSHAPTLQPSHAPEPLRLSFARAAKGSGVTRIDRLAANPQHKEDLLKTLKRRLGCGGAVKGGVLEIQGDHRDRIEKELVALGYRVRRIGG